jgi:hypothetical protein
MPLATLRRHQQWILWLLVGVTVLVFGLFGTEFAIRDLLTGGGSGVQGYYRGKPIKTDEFITFRNRWGRLYGRRSGADEEGLHQFLITQMILLREAREAGLRVTDEEVLERLKRMVKDSRRQEDQPAPPETGDDVFDHDAYANLLRVYDMGKATFETTIREQLLVEKYEKAMLEATQASGFENWVSFEKESTELKARYLSFRSDEFSEMEQPSEGEVKEFFESNCHPDPGAPQARSKGPGRYFQPDRVAIEYAFVTFKSIERELEGSFKASAEEIEAHYLKHRTKFKNTEESVKSGKPPVKSLGEVYDQVAGEIRENKARELARERIDRVTGAWDDRAREDTPEEKLGPLLKTLCDKFGAAYHGRTPPFSEFEVDESQVGPIARVEKLKEKAFKVYDTTRGQKPWTASEARYKLSDTILGNDGYYVLHIVSMKPRYSPSWEEMKNGRVPGLTFDKVLDDLKVYRGFKRAQEEARKFRTAIYDKAMEGLGKELGTPVQTLEVTESGKLPGLGAAEDAVTQMALKTEIGQVSRPFEAAGRQFLLLVTEGSESKRNVEILSVEPTQLDRYEPKPSDTLLEFFYERVKTQKAYQSPDQVETEYLVAELKTLAEEIRPTDEEIAKHYEENKAKFVDAEGKPRGLDQVKEGVVAAIREAGAYDKAKAAIQKALENELLKSEKEAEKSEKERLEEQDKLEDLAAQHKLRYAKDLERFRPDDAAKRDKALGPAVAYSEGIEKLLAELKTNKWSELRESPAGPFVIRVVKRSPGGPAPFEEVRGKLAENYRSGWERRPPEDKLSTVWEEQLHQSFSQVEQLNPIPKRTRKVFSARESGYFERGSTPSAGADEPSLAKALEKLKPGDLSEVVAESGKLVIALVSSEREEKKLKVEYGEVMPADFRPGESEVKEEDLRAYYERHKEQFRSPTEVEIEYVMADLADFEKKLEGKLTEADFRRHYDDHRIDYYKDMSFEEAKPLIERDLPREQAAKEAKEIVDGKDGKGGAFASALKAEKRDGPDLEQTAKNHGLSYARVKYSRHEAVGPSLAHLGSRDQVPLRAFKMKDGEIAGTFRTATACFFFRRLRAIDSETYPFETVKNKVLDACMANLADDRARAWVASVVEKAKALPLKDAVAAVPYPQGKEAPKLAESDFLSKYSQGSVVPPSGLRDAALKLGKSDAIGPIDAGQKVCFGKITDEKVENQIRALSVTFRVDSFRPPEFMASDEEVKAQYEADKEGLKKPDQRRLEYLFASISDLIESEKVKALATDEAVKAFYDAHKSEYWKDPQKSKEGSVAYLPLEQVNNEVVFFVRQAEAKKLADELVGKAQERIKSSESPASADLDPLAKDLGLRHGKTELFARERPEDPIRVWKHLEQVSRLGEIAFEIKEGQVLADERLSAGNGRALVRLAETKASYIPDLSEVRDAVVQKVLDKRSPELAREFVGSVYEKLKKAVSEAATVHDKQLAFNTVVKESFYLADSSLRPVDRETEYFWRPLMNPFDRRRRYWSVPGLGSASGNYDLQAQFALAAFELPRGRVSAPVCGERDESECYLVLLSGTRWPSEEEFKGQKRLGSYGDWEIFQAASSGWREVITRLGEPRR